MGINAYYYSKVNTKKKQYGIILLMLTANYLKIKNKIFMFYR